jgi:uncharacterized protein YjiS (DUF1127 family)
MKSHTALIAVTLKRYLDNHKTRSRLKKRLIGMPAREVDRLAWDVGLSRTELLREAHSPFWKKSLRIRSTQTPDPDRRALHSCPQVHRMYRGRTT